MQIIQQCYGDYNGNGTVESIKTELTTGSGFKPISSIDSIYFRGSFDGLNHRIDNLYINVTSTTDKSYGLFGAANNSTFQNIIISGNVRGAGNTRGAGLLGCLQNSNVINCHNEVNSTNTADYSMSSGLLAQIGDGYVRNSSNSGNVSGGISASGLVGHINSNSSLIVENSYNTGTITNSIGLYAAGLVVDPYSNSTLKIYNSYNSGNITITKSGTTYTGGLVGKSTSQVLYIYNSYNTGTITNQAESSTNSSIGGLIGQIDTGTIINSYNTGSVLGGNQTGGIIGNKNNVTTNLFINNCFNAGTISTNFSGSYVGGLIGYSKYNTTSKMIIFNSYNIGSVTSTYQAGGFFGQTNSSIYPINVYNVGSVSGTTSAGFVGTTQSRYMYFNNLFNYGNITGSKKYGLYYRNSGNTNSILNSYYLAGISGSNISGYTGTSLTAQYMASPDFVNQLNQNKRNIDLSTIYSGALSAYSSYELSDWKYDAEKGYPILDN